MNAATAIRNCLHPYAIQEGPFATVGGYAEVLEALGQVDPGAGLALALEETSSEAALETWRSVGQAVHESIDTGELQIRDGLAVLETAAEPQRLIADLLLAYRSPEPTVLVVGDDEAAISSHAACHDALAAIAASEDAYDTVADGTAGTATVDAGTDDLVETLEEVRA
ncbi:MAG: hypothetical protein U5K37_01795 [Natrialbaceae archaeon]|nr:hypothetical protein [Natrialbaceae archaeon]